MTDTQISTLRYGFTSLPIAAIGVIYYILLPKYISEQWHISLVELGTVIVISRVIDALLDPLVGNLLERVTIQYKALLRIACIVTALAFSLFFIMPSSLPTAHSASLLFLAISLLLFISVSFFTIPYEAFAISWPCNHSIRNRLMASKEGFALLGAVLAGSAPWIIGQLTSVSQSKALELTSIACCALLLFSVFIVGNFPGKRNRQVSPAIFQTLGLALRLREFRYLSLANTLSALSAAIASSLMLFYVEVFLQSAHGTTFLAAYFVAGLLGMPLWLRFGEYLSKQHCFLAACLCNAGIFAITFFLQTGDEFFFGLIVIGSGLGLGGTLIFPASLQADVTARFEQHFTQKREASLVALWSLMRKMATAIGSGCAILMLGAAGHQPDIGSQSEGVLLVLRTTYCIAPAVLLLSAALVSMPLRELDTLRLKEKV